MAVVLAETEVDQRQAGHQSGAIETRLAAHQDLPASAKGKAGDGFEVTVPVYFHVVTDGTTGALTNAQIEGLPQVTNAVAYLIGTGADLLFRLVRHFEAVYPDVTVEPKDAADPANTIHLKLVPKPGIDIDETQIDVWFEEPRLPFGNHIDCLRDGLPLFGDGGRDFVVRSDDGGGDADQRLRVYDFAPRPDRACA